MKSLRKIGMGVVGAILVGTGASAATVNFDFGGNTIFTVECVACADGDILGYQTNDEAGDALLVGGSWQTTGTAFNPVNGTPSDRNPDLSGAADEINFVNVISGESFTGISKDESTNVPNPITGEYILFKSANYAGVLKNLTGGSIVLSYFTQTTGAGLSHVSEFGGPTPVPLPAGSVLLLSALGFGAYASRRRKAV